MHVHGCAGCVNGGQRYVVWVISAGVSCEHHMKWDSMEGGPSAARLVPASDIHNLLLM